VCTIENQHRLTILASLFGFSASGKEKDRLLATIIKCFGTKGIEVLYTSSFST